MFDSSHIKVSSVVHVKKGSDRDIYDYVTTLHNEKNNRWFMIICNYKFIVIVSKKPENKE